MPKKSIELRTNVKLPEVGADGDTLAPMAYPIAETSVTAMQVYHNPERKPGKNGERGPWDEEADKIGWIDEETGIRCIILRQKNGSLSGYAAVDPDNPLFGYTHDALPADLASSVHGGVTYGKDCEENNHSQVRVNPRQERYTVCHVTMTRTVWDTKTVQDTEDKFTGEDEKPAWWFGFNTDHAGDYVPLGTSTQREHDRIYRDQAYVYAQCIALARRLKAIGEKADKLDDSGEWSTPMLPRPNQSGGAS